MSVLVGSAHAIFSLQYESLTQGVPAIEQQLGRLRQQTRTPITVSVDGARAAQGLQQTGRAADQALRQFQALERTFDRTRDSEIRAARAAGDHARALQLIDEALGRAETGTMRYNNLLAQQATAQRAAAREATAAARAPAPAPTGEPSNVNAALKTSPIGQIAGVFGFAFGAQQLVQYGTSAVQARNELAKVENTTRLLTKTQQGYNDVIELARRNQELYGGSLAENIGNLTGFAVAARRSGVEVATLNNLSQRLAILSPEQGAEGASIAINEALSGNASSLVRRFEIPRELLKGISDESKTAAERLKILDDALTKSGVSSDVVDKAVDETTKSVNRASAAFDDLKTASGEALAPLAGLLAEATTSMLRFGQTTQNTSTNFFAGSKNFDEYRAKFDSINDPIARALGFYPQLTKAQYEAARAMVANGKSAQEAVAGVQILTGFEVQLTGATQRQRDAFTQLAPKVALVANQSEYSRTAIAGLMEAFFNGSLTSDQFAIALDRLNVIHAQTHPILIRGTAAYDIYANVASKGAVAAQRAAEAFQAEQSRVAQDGNRVGCDRAQPAGAQRRA